MLRLLAAIPRFLAISAFPKHKGSSGIEATDRQATSLLKQRRLLRQEQIFSQEPKTYIDGESGCNFVLLFAC